MSGQLSRRGLLIADQGSLDALTKALKEGGGLQNKSIAAWVRAEFAADILLVIKARQSAKDLGQTEVGYQQIQESLKGLYRSESTLEVKIFDLKSLRTVSSFSSTAQSTSLGKSKSLTESLSKALNNAAENIRKEIDNL